MSLENTSETVSAKHQIAQIVTLVSSRQLGQQQVMPDNHT